MVAPACGGVSLRQIVETVYEKLHHVFRLQRERPHELGGFAARLAAKVGLHNFCIWLNRSLGRPPLQFADLLDWWDITHTKRLTLT